VTDSPKCQACHDTGVFADRPAWLPGFCACWYGRTQRKRYEEAQRRWLEALRSTAKEPKP